MGIPTKLMRQLYLTVAVPKFTYGTDIWFRLIRRRGSNVNVTQRGSKGIVKRLTSIQRIAALSITGTMRTSPTDVLEAHANLLPIPLLLQNICHRATVCLATLPQSHPLYSKLQWIAGHNVQTHHSSLHNLLHTFCIFPNDVETINLSNQTRAPEEPAYKTQIAKDKKAAKQEHEQLKDVIRIYSDRSGYKDRIGAAAVLL